MTHLYPIDYQYYNANEGSRLNFDVWAFIQVFFSTFRSVKLIDIVLYPLSFVCFVGMLLIREPGRKTLLWVCVIWGGIYLILLGLYGYLPSRYFLTLIIPIVVLVAITWNFLWENYRKSWVTILCTVAIVISCLINIYKISGFISSPRFSFRDMAADVGRQLENIDDGKGVLMGHFANTVGIATGRFTVNDFSGTRDLSFRIERYRPNGYICLGEMDPKIEEVLSSYYTVEYLKTYDVFDNYYRGNRVRFHRLYEK